MSTISGIALSGMNAAMLRLTASASNIVNARSTGPLPDAPNPAGHRPVYTPLRVDQWSVPGGGTQARIVPSVANPIPTYDPDAPYADDDGMVASPDIDLTGEIVELVSARLAFIASVRVLQADADMYRALFSIKA